MFNILFRFIARAADTQQYNLIKFLLYTFKHLFFG
jgi:hypothetical protein